VFVNESKTGMESVFSESGLGARERSAYKLDSRIIGKS
jgi:hypothetical protein